MDILSALDTATVEFGRRLGLVGEESRTLPTPCAEWDVQYLAAHVVGGNRFAVHVLGGMTATDPDLVDVVLSIVENGPPGMGFGVAGRARLPTGASAQSRLLEHTGRSVE